MSPSFRSLFSRRLLVASGLALVLPSCAQAQTAPLSPPAVKTKAPVKPHAVWVWGPTLIADAVAKPQAQTDFFNFANQHYFQTIFLNTNDLLRPTPLEANNPQHLDHAKLAAFLRTAHAKGMRIFALQGDPTYALTENHQPVLDRLQKLIDFNASVKPDERFDGIQWDIEPYLLPKYRENDASAAEVKSQFLDLVSKMRDLLKTKNAASLEIGFAFPFWMDGENHRVEWGGSTKPTTMHLMDVLNTLPKSHLAIMAYNDKPEQSMKFSEDEVKYAIEQTPKVKIWVSQEVGDHKGEPLTISYFDNGNAAFNAALQKFDAAYADQKVVAGIAVHDWAAYHVLLERP